MSLSKVIEIARGELGVTENPPGSNRVKYWDSYDPKMQGQPWCVCFLWWVFQQAGERMAFFGGGKTASCSVLLRWYREQGLTVAEPFTSTGHVHDIEIGDIVLLNFNGGNSPEHCGLVVDASSMLWVETVEGNTSSADYSQSNGGMVCEKKRYPSQIVAVCRPKYKPEETYPRDDVTGHWAESAIRRVVKRGLMVGYTDGSFQPDKPVTRAELAVILDRLDKEDDLR